MDLSAEEQRRFDGLDGSKLRNEIETFLNEKFAGTILGYKNGNAILETKRGAHEYAWPEMRQRYDDAHKAKFRASANLDELLEVSQFDEHLPYEEVKEDHPEAERGIDRYTTYFNVGGQYYSGTINVLKQKRVDTLYDIVSVKNIAGTDIHPPKEGGQHTSYAFDNSIASPSQGINTKKQLNISVERYTIFGGSFKCGC